MGTVPLSNSNMKQETMPIESKESAPMSPRTNGYEECFLSHVGALTPIPLIKGCASGPRETYHSGRPDVDCSPTPQAAAVKMRALSATPTSTI
eukprot:1375497-Amphidinium_carterae.1